MPAKTSKRYVAPVVTADPASIQQAINKIYDDLNDLAQATVQSSNETASRTSGQKGDIRLIENKSTGKAVIRGRTDNGWVDVAEVDMATAFEKDVS